MRRTGKGPIASWISNWRARLLPRAEAGSVAVPDDAPAVKAYAGEYKGLYKYLKERYANRVVLSFVEIEDLLGFALPDPARRQSEWWDTGAVSHRSAQSDSWTLASRTATVNLAAQNVLFERHA